MIVYITQQAAWLAEQTRELWAYMDDNLSDNDPGVWAAKMDVSDSIGALDKVSTRFPS